jgi:hypothetical protein
MFLSRLKGLGLLHAHDWRGLLEAMQEECWHGFQVLQQQQRGHGCKSLRTPPQNGGL